MKFNPTQSGSRLSSHCQKELQHFAGEAGGSPAECGITGEHHSITGAACLDGWTMPHTVLATVAFSKSRNFKFSSLKFSI